MLMEDFPTTLIEFEQRFATEEACRAYLMEMRWPEGWHCPRCGQGKAWRTGRNLLHCAGCGHQSSLTAGTVMHGTRHPLLFWFRAMFLMMTQKNGMSAKTLQRHLGISYPTAWTWLHKLRDAMVRPDRESLSGHVEVDEAYIGGEDESGTCGRHKGKKSIVVVAVESKDDAMGRARLITVENVSAETLCGVVQSHVAPASTIHTDGWGSYAQLKTMGYHHKPDPVRGDKEKIKETLRHAHQVVGLLERWLLGTHQGAVRERHLQAYLDEFIFRFNRRRATHRTLLFQRLAEQVITQKARPYWKIIGRRAPNEPLHLVAA